MSIKSIQLIIICTGLTGLLVAGCDKDVVTQLDTDSNLGKANLKIIHASAYAINYQAQLKVNDVRVSNVITNATPFPGGGLNTGGASSPWYMALDGGVTKISLSVPKVGTSADSISLFSGTVNTEVNNYYSAYLTDTSVQTQLVFIEENISPPAANTSRYKFVNIMPNQPALDLYWGANKIASNIEYTRASAEFTLVKGDTARWSIRPAGALPTSDAIAIYPALTPTFAASQTVPNQRVLTVFARGYSGSTGNRTPNISLLYNY